MKTGDPTSLVKSPVVINYGSKKYVGVACRQRVIFFNEKKALEARIL